MSADGDTLRKALAWCSVTVGGAPYAGEGIPALNRLEAAIEERENAMSHWLGEANDERDKRVAAETQRDALAEGIRSAAENGETPTIRSWCRLLLAEAGLE